MEAAARHVIQMVAVVIALPHTHGLATVGSGTRGIWGTNPQSAMSIRYPMPSGSDLPCPLALRLGSRRHDMALIYELEAVNLLVPIDLLELAEGNLPMLPTI